VGVDLGVLGVWVEEFVGGVAGVLGFGVLGALVEGDVVTVLLPLFLSSWYTQRPPIARPNTSNKATSAPTTIASERRLDDTSGSV
jgi:hypothetical protein